MSLRVLGYPIQSGSMIPYDPDYTKKAFLQDNLFKALIWEDLCKASDSGKSSSKLREEVEGTLPNSNRFSLVVTPLSSDFIEEKEALKSKSMVLAESSEPLMMPD
ncbi:hypothetical protein CEXT_279311 [Caerostris extrusa]|uniref:Uncharacterized protein n=1 Tax=Caerostris extrusa TaxID=172846 RepID=A0AAV4XWS8_CAEEX|nr:hypothetical protein CEXT_279311 [Caerostris extrusa]